MKLLSLLGLLFCLAPLGLAQKKSALTGLEPGQIAPPIGELEWLFLGDPQVKRETRLSDLRGSVVLIADYGYYCDSCVRIGVPLANALRASNDPKDLHVIHLTAGIGEDTSELIKKEGEKLGIAGPVGITDVEGQGSPYLDMNANGNLTYAYVIGRHGGIVWKGDPSRKREECLAAVSAALNAVPCQPLPSDPSAFGPLVAPALRSYVMGEFEKSRIEAEALIKKLTNKQGAEFERARSDAAALLALIATTRQELMDELERSGGIHDAERFQRTKMQVLRVYPKGPEANRVGELDMVVSIQSGQGLNCRRWGIWYDLEAARPPTFPAERDPAGAKYARELGKYVKQPDVPGLERANAWLAIFEKVQARK